MARTLHSIFVLVLVVSIAMISGCADRETKTGRRYQEEGDYEQAIHHYKLALEKNPENRSIRYSLVESYALQLTDKPEREVTAEMVEQTMLNVRPVAEPLMDDVNIKRYVSIIYRLTAKRYAEAGMDDKAAEMWAEVIEIEPSFAEGHYNLGVALTKQGKHEEALPRFEESVYLNPYFIKGYYLMGNALVALERSGEAIDPFLKGLEINPDDIEIRHDLGIAYEHTGQNEKAVEELEKAIEIEPGFFLAYRNLARIYKKMGDTEKVKEIDKKWLEFAETHIKSEKDEQDTDTAETADSG